jgi:hypothetical protein
MPVSNTKDASRPSSFAKPVMCDSRIATRYAQGVSGEESAVGGSLCARMDAIEHAGRAPLISSDV